MPLWLVHEGTSFGSVVWSDGKQGDVYVYCKETGLFHPNGNMTYSYYTSKGPYRFMEVGPGEAGIEIQNGIGEHGPSRSGLVNSYAANPENLTVRNVMLTVASERGRV